MGEIPGLILDLSEGSARIEHSTRLPISARVHEVRFEDVSLSAVVRHSSLVPATNGAVFHTGIQFRHMTDPQMESVRGILMAEMHAQVREWEYNLNAIPFSIQPPAHRSRAAQRYLWLQWTERGWQRSETLDPNQPLDGLAVAVEETPEHVRMLCDLYASGDERTRDHLRHCAALAIAEVLRRLRP
jgi:hypothetical protein